MKIQLQPTDFNILQEKNYIVLKYIAFEYYDKCKDMMPKERYDFIKKIPKYSRAVFNVIVENSLLFPDTKQLLMCKSSDEREIVLKQMAQAYGYNDDIAINNKLLEYEVFNTPALFNDGKLTPMVDPQIIINESIEVKEQEPNEEFTDHDKHLEVPSNETNDIKLNIDDKPDTQMDEPDIENININKMEDGDDKEMSIHDLSDLGDLNLLKKEPIFELDNYLAIKNEVYTLFDRFANLDLEKKIQFIKILINEGSEKSKLAIGTFLLPRDDEVINMLSLVTITDVAEYYHIPIALLEYKQDEYEMYETKNLIKIGKLSSGKANQSWFAHNEFTNDKSFDKEYHNPIVKEQIDNINKEIAHLFEANDIKKLEKA